jgi:hypothetical protein
MPGKRSVYSAAWRDYNRTELPSSPPTLTGMSLPKRAQKALGSSRATAHRYSTPPTMLKAPMIAWCTGAPAAPSLSLLPGSPHGSALLALRYRANPPGSGGVSSMKNRAGRPPALIGPCPVAGFTPKADKQAVALLTPAGHWLRTQPCSKPLAASLPIRVPGRRIVCSSDYRSAANGELQYLVNGRVEAEYPEAPHGSCAQYHCPGKAKPDESVLNSRGHHGALAAAASAVSRWPCLRSTQPMTSIAAPQTMKPMSQ